MDIGWKLASSLSVAGAGVLANLVVNSGWKMLTGKKPPENREGEAQAGVVEVVVFAAVSGIIAALIQRAVLRKTNQWYGGVEKDPLGLGNVGRHQQH